MPTVPTPDAAPTRRRLRELTRRSDVPAVPDPGASAGDALFRAVFAQAPIGMLLMNRERVITRANDACCRLLGRTSEELTGLSCSDLSHPEERPIGLDLFGQMISGELQGYRVEKRLIRPDGTPLWAEITVSLIADAPEDEQVIAQMEDVTQRRRDEGALTASARELARHAADLERSKAELEQFAYVASHDLSEPLRAVSGFVRLLGDRYRDELDDDARAFIDFAVSGTDRMQRLIDDLLRYSRAGRPGMELEPVPLDEVAQLVVAGLNEAIRDAGAEVEIDELPVVLGDRGQLAQLLQNLVANAVKFVPADRPPRVTISAEDRGGLVAVWVEDNGIGIEPGAGERVFKVFQRLHEREAYSGTGIGLAIAKKITERHGGRIWHEPGASGGSRFCFTLRAAPADASPPAARGLTRPAPAAPGTPLS